MPIKVYKPTTPARRKTSVLINKDAAKKRPEKSLTKIIKKKAGRSHGTIAVRHKGGGAKRFYRIIDFKRNKFDIPAKVEAIEYDPNRNAAIALLKYEDGEKRYIIAPEGLKAGNEVVSSRSKTEIKAGNCMPLEHIPAGSVIHNVELMPGRGAGVVRSAGGSATVMGHEGKYVQIKMPSGEVRLFFKTCLATIGQVSNADFRNVRIGKAGRKRHMGIRPTVRGKVMNPVDHPHGGGEGRQPIGLVHPKTPWGKSALGVKTRKKNKWSDKFIVSRRKRKRR